MTRAREWQVSLDFKARLDEDAAFDLMEALGRYGASVAVDPGHTGGGLTLAVDAPDGETALDKALTLLEKNMPGATVTGLGRGSGPTPWRETASPYTRRWWAMPRSRA